MTLRTTAAGTLGLVLALVWVLAFLYQRHHLGLLTGWVLSDAPVALRVSSAWSVLQVGITALLAIPLAVTSVAVMLGAVSMRRFFRIALLMTAMLSVGVLSFYAVLAVSRVADGGPFLLANPRITYELLVASVTLALQVAIWMLQPRDRDRDTAVRGVAGSRRRIPGHSRPSSSHDARLAALPGPPATARG